MANNTRREQFINKLDELTRDKTVKIKVDTTVDRDSITDNLEERLARELITDR